MTPDDITKLARKAGWKDLRECDSEDIFMGKTQDLERFAALVAAAEREECARVCENEWSTVAERMYGQECATAIRARGGANV